MNTNTEFQAGYDAYTAGEDESILHGQSAEFDRGFWAAHNDSFFLVGDVECLDSYMGDCDGIVEYRPAMSPTGKSYPRCDAHFDARMTTQRRIVRDYGGQMFY